MTSLTRGVRRSLRGGPSAAEQLAASVRATLIHLWELDGASDLSDRVGAVALTASGTITSAAGPGGSGSAATTDGANGNYLSCSDATLPAGSSDRSFGCWLYWDGSAPDAAKFFMNYGTFGQPGQFVGAYLQTDETVQVSQFGENVTTLSALAASTWYHLAVTVESSVWSIYVNGSLAASGAMATDTVLGGTLRLGADGAQIGGRFRQVTVADRAWTADQVYYLANPGAGVPRPYPFG